MISTQFKTLLLSRLRQAVGFSICYLLICSFPLTAFSQMKIAGAAASGNKKSSKKASGSKSKNGANKEKSALATPQDEQSAAERIDVTFRWRRKSAWIRL